MTTTRRRFLKHAGASVLASTVAVRQNEAPAASESRRAKTASGPLQICKKNPRYFADSAGRAVYLCGSHVWNNLVDMGPGYPPPAFDYTAYLDFLDRYGHNFIRLWTWENFTWDTSANRKWAKPKPHTVAPHPWARTGPGEARDGRPKFDLTRFDDDYFRRLRRRVIEAGNRGIYVSVMLFEGWAMQRMQDAWLSHPFHPDNNINGIDGDLNGDGKGLEVHTLGRPKITSIQEAYVRKVIETVGDLDNVLYEISNENHPASTKWQYHMIRFIKKQESARAKQHPVGMTFQFRGGSNQTLFDSPADWISPNPEGGYQTNPPANDGRKVIIADTDHLWGIGGTADWVWKSFTRGLNPIFMDPYDGAVLAGRFDPRWEPVRVSMGVTRKLASHADMTAMVPRGDLATTGYCLAHPGKSYVAYAPRGGEMRVDFSAASSRLKVVLIDAATGKMSNEQMIHPRVQTFAAPNQSGWVVWLRAEK